MKTKCIFTIILSLVTAHALTAAPSTTLTSHTSLNAVKDYCQTGILDLPFWAKTRVAGIGFLGGAFGFFLARALSTLFHPTQRPLNFWNPTTYSTFEKISTPTCFVLAWLKAKETECPEYVAKADDIKLLLFIQDLSSRPNITPDICIEELSLYFINSPYPLAMTVLELQNLKLRLLRITELLKSISCYATSTLHKNIAAQVTADAYLIQKMLNIVEKDVRYPMQQHAMMLNRIQNHQEHQTAANLVGTILDISLSSSNNR